MAKEMKPRLGRGLSGLMARPVEVLVGTNVVETINQASSHRAIKPSSGDGDGLGLRRIDVGAIVPNRFQPRGVMDEAGLEGLAGSIRVTGVMQPVVVRRAEGGEGGSRRDTEDAEKRESGKWKAESGNKRQKAALVSEPTSGTPRYELVAGERRWRAAVRAGLSEVPAIVVELDDKGAAEWALVENLQREDLGPIDKARAFRRLVDEFAMTHGDVAERIGIDRTSVANTLRLLDLEAEIQELVATGKLTMGHAKALLNATLSAAAKSGFDRVEAARKAASAGWSVREMEQWAAEAARKWAGGVLKGAAGGGRSAVGDEEGLGAMSPVVAALEKQLGEHLGTKVKLRTVRGGKKGRIEVEFYSVDHFEGLLERMGFRMES